MKKTFLFLLIMGLSSLISAQFATNFRTISYQAILRDVNGELLKNQQVSVRVSLIANEINNPEMFTERHVVQSNENGLLSLEIGGGTYVSGLAYGNIYFGQPMFVKTEIDPAGGTNYSLVHSSKLLSVPSANHAFTSTHMDGWAWNFVGAYEQVSSAPDWDAVINGFSYFQYLAPDRVLWTFRTEDVVYEVNGEEVTMVGPLVTWLGIVTGNQVEFIRQGFGFYGLEDEEEVLMGELNGDQIKIYYKYYPSEFTILKRK